MASHPENLTVEDRLDPWVMMRRAIMILGERVYVWVVLAMSFALFGYAVVKPEPLRILAASLWTLLIHVPLAWRERKRA